MDNEGFFYLVDRKKQAIILYPGEKIFIQWK
jgi:long-subunit acyl-CoA synthetase (AMP-forming)